MIDQLTIDIIRASFPRSYYQRGYNYQRQRRVLSLEWDDDNEMLYGEVRGSGRNVYEQEISFEKARSSFSGTCSCPVGYNCKHVVAVLLEWIARKPQNQGPHRKKQRDRLLDWQEKALQRLREEAANPYPEPGQTCLLHVLESKIRYATQVVELKTVKSRRLKKGGWGKTSPYHLKELTGNFYATSTPVLPQDKEIAQLLQEQMRFSGNHPILEGDVGLLVLRRLLRSRRCFFREPGEQPLDFGPIRRMSIDWKRDGATIRCHMQLEDGPDNWILIPTEPAWYMDPEAGLCGPIENQPCPSSLLNALQTLPKLPQARLTELSYFLSEILPPQSIPLPVELELKEVSGPPLPTLILRGVIDPGGVRRHLLRVRFRYGPLSLPPLLLGGKERELRRQEDTTFLVLRAPEEENRALEQLEKLLLHSAPPALSEAGEMDLLFQSHSREHSAQLWKELLDQLPAFEKAGWHIEIDPSFNLSFETANRLLADIEESDNAWFELGLEIDHQGQRIDLLPLLLQWLENDNPQCALMYPLADNRWLEIPPSVLSPVVDTLVEIFDVQHLKVGPKLKLPHSLAHNLITVEEKLGTQGHQLTWHGSKKVHQLAQKLRHFKGIKKVAPPQGLQVQLRDYQCQGLNWMQFLREHEFNGILADDMGLGKTVQTLCHLLLEKEAGRLTQPALIVAPTSVLSNWYREAERFTPELRCLVLHGPERAVEFERLTDYDLVVTSYALLTRDRDLHLQQHYHSLILDEAQAIKNPRSKNAQVASQIRARHRLCLTGTPLENHLGELWSLFHFLMPGFLGSEKQFNRLFRTPIERHKNTARQQLLQQRISPFVLRRTKEQVTRELPPKTIMVREAELGPAQAKLYESIRLAMVKRVGRLLEKKGFQKSHIEILDALLKLRQVCCDPRLVKLETAARVKQSVKLDELMALLPKLLDEGRKVLLFSQFTSMLSLIEDELQTHCISYSKLTGYTRKRDEAIAAFQEGPAQVFLISLKAGGVGLNLTAADTVIHYDPWWNPAVENQATDRAHRIGQEKPVFVYKLVAKGTIEEKILALQERKQQLAEGVYGKEKQEFLSRLSADDILELLSPLEEK